MDSIIITVVLVLMTVLILFYVFKSKIYSLLGGLLKVGFIVSILFVLSGLFFQAPYDALANLTLEKTGILEQVRAFDDSTDIQQVLSPIEDWLVQLNLRERDEAAEAVKANTPGALETNFYPGLVTLLSSIYRIVSTILALAGMVLVIYLETITEAYRKIQSLESRLKKLEAQQAPKQIV